MFQGFSQATGDFLWGLALNNDRTWFTEHRSEYEAHLNQPFRALTEETLALMREAFPETDFHSHISRIYRDARRLFGRGPFKDHLWFTLQSSDKHVEGPVFWFELSGVDWSYGAGIWEDRADFAETFRETVDADPKGFEAMVLAIAERGEYRLWGEAYKRPKADRGPILNPWYNRKHFSVGYMRPYGGDLYSDRLPRTLFEAYRDLMPMYLFLLKVYRQTCARHAALRELSLFKDT